MGTDMPLHYINVFLCIMVMKLEAPIFSNQCMDDIKVNAGTTDADEEASDSNSSSNRSHKHCRRLRSNQKGPLSSIYKGVVPQQNGHWGAQIYANHQRIWLGTFKSEIEAASAYDSAAIKLRSGDSYRNLPPTDTTRELEPSFQSNHTTEDILNMIKDGSYPVKFADFLRAQDTKLTLGNGGESHARGEAAGQVCRELFQKELTPSDVGKLNRLVIPKKYAVKYFPHVEEGMEDGADGGEGEGGHDTTLTFCDRTRRVWKFRYCYWKSSQSFVFTRGWNRFVKEKELKSKDIVSFYMVEANEGQISWMIDVNHGKGGGAANSRSTEESGHNSLIASEPKPENSNSNADSNDKQPIEVEEATSKRKPVRLFGVDISCR